MPALPPSQEPQQHYGRGRGGRPRGGFGQTYAHQQHSQPYPSQYTSPQWQQPQPFYPHNGAQNPYAASHFNPYAAYYPQQYGGYPYYNQPYQNFIPPQSSSIYGSQPHQIPYGQSPYVLNAPQQPIVHGSHSPFPQPQVSVGQSATSAVPNVPLTPASAHSSQFTPAPSNEPFQQPAETSIEDSQPPDQAVNGNGNGNGDTAFDVESAQQPAISCSLEMPVATSEDTPKPNPQFSINQVSSNGSTDLTPAAPPPPSSSSSSLSLPFSYQCLCADILIANRCLTTPIQIARGSSRQGGASRRKSGQLRVKTLPCKHRNLAKPRARMWRQILTPMILPLLAIHQPTQAPRTKQQPSTKPTQLRPLQATHSQPPKM